VITDSNLSGSDNLKITIKDDGNGNLYKANNNGVHATWSSVGHIFYDEGIAVIKSPHLYEPTSHSNCLISSITSSLKKFLESFIL
jgi:hypothetical protein